MENTIHKFMHIFMLLLALWKLNFIKFKIFVVESIVKK